MREWALSGIGDVMREWRDNERQWGVEMGVGAKEKWSRKKNNSRGMRS